MKKHDTKLSVRRNTLRTLDVAAVRGGLPPPSFLCDRPTDDTRCYSDDEGSHAPSCGSCNHSRFC